MAFESAIRARLSFKQGKHTQEPNLVMVPAAVKTFPVTVEWSMQSEPSYVIGSHDHGDAHRWCVLDANLRPVMYGGGAASGRMSKKAEPMVTRTLHGGGASNPRQVTFEFSSAKLKHGATYTLIASRHGVMAAGEFVAVRESKAKPAAKKAKKKVARKKTKAKPAAKKVARKAKAAPKPKKKTAARKKTAA